MVCTCILRIGGKLGNKVQYVKVRFGIDPTTITVLHLQIGFFICKFRTCGELQDPTKPHFNILYLNCFLAFAPPILHYGYIPCTNHFLDRELRV